MFCGNCGTQLVGQVNFCGNCGAKVIKPAPETIKKIRIIYLEP